MEFMKLKKARTLALSATGILLTCSLAFPAELGPEFARLAQAAASGSLAELSLEELLNIPLTIASKKETKARTAPGIVSLITAEEIAHSGARDLIDVLRMVPGFDFGLDVQGGIGLGIRGQWGHEGKILLLIDGLEMNETLYSTLQFGSHYPLDLIDRIEIVRGPGSAMYGGFSELAVINIHTRKPQAAEGAGNLRAAFSAGTLPGALGHGQGSIFYGRKQGDWRFSAGISTTAARRSEREYRDSAGATYSMLENSSLASTFVNLNLGYRSLDVRFISDTYKTTQRDAYGTNLSTAVPTDFQTYLLGIKYDWEVSPQFTLTPHLIFRQYRPWTSTAPETAEADGAFYNAQAHRDTVQLSSLWKLGEEMDLLSGLEWHYDHAEALSNTDLFFNNQQELNFTNATAFSQLSAGTPLGNVTVGARIERHSQFGTSFVPRAALAKVLDAFHFKLLYSRGFRAPSIENINLNQAIRPEKVDVAELELGYRLDERNFLTANVFDIRISDPIIYTYEEKETYRNFDRTGSQGFELEYRFRPSWGQASLGYSFYRAFGNTVDYYRVPDHENLLLAFPAHKLTLSGSYRVPEVEGLRLNPSLRFLSSRFAYDYSETTGALALRNFPPAWLLNLYASLDRLPLPGLEAGIGIFNILDQDHRFLQPYTGGHASLPDRGREVVFKLAYEVKM